jgi:hypothetical protein
VVIERLQRIDSKLFYRKYVTKNLPVIITGDQSLCDAARTWSFDYLLSGQGDVEVPVEFASNQAHPELVEHRHMKLNHYIGLLRSDLDARKHYYLAEIDLAAALPHNADDVPPPHFLDTDDIFRTVLFLGVDTFSQAHYHPPPMEAVLMQVVGKKRVILWPANRFRDLSPHPWFSSLSHWTSLSIDPKARERCGVPFYSKSGKKAIKTAIVCDLMPGQMLFIPQGWFHAVYGMGESVSVTYFFNSLWSNSYFPIAVRDSFTWLKMYISSRIPKSE